MVWRTAARRWVPSTWTVRMHGPGFPRCARRPNRSSAATRSTPERRKACALLALFSCSTMHAFGVQCLLVHCMCPFEDFLCGKGACWACPNIVRHPYKEDPKMNPTLDNYPHVSDVFRTEYLVYEIFVSPSALIKSELKDRGGPDS